VNQTGTQHERGAEFFVLILSVLHCTSFYVHDVISVSDHAVNVNFRLTDFFIKLHIRHYAGLLAILSESIAIIDCDTAEESIADSDSDTSKASPILSLSTAIIDINYPDTL
jgi:hypothetical protein